MPMAQSFLRVPAPQSRRLNGGLPFVGLLSRVAGTFVELRKDEGVPGVTAPGALPVAAPARAALTASSVGPVQGIVMSGGDGNPRRSIKSSKLNCSSGF